MNEQVALFASNSDGGAISCWDLHTGSQLCQYKGNASSRNCVALLGDHHLVAAQANKGPLLFWAWHKDAAVQRAFAAGQVTCIATTHCGTYLAAGSSTGVVWVWDVASGRLLATWHAHFKAASALAWSSSGTFLVTGGEDTQVCVALTSELVDVRQQQQQYQPLHTWSGHTLPITALAMGAGDVDALVCSASLDHHVKLWSISQGTLLRSIVLPSAPLCLVLEACEQRVYAGGDGGDVYEIALHGNHQDHPTQLQHTPFALLQGHTTSVTCMAITNDGVHLVAGAQDGSARMYQLASRQVVRVYEGPAKGPLTGVLVTDKRPAMVPGSLRVAPSRPQPLAPLCKYEGMPGALGPYEDAVVLLSGGDDVDARHHHPHTTTQEDAAGVSARELGAMQQQLDQALHTAQAWQAVSNQLQALVCERLAQS